MATQRPSAMITEVGRRLGGETISTTHPIFSSGAVLGWLNDTLAELTSICIEKRWSPLFTSKSISIVAEQQAYDIPGDCESLQSLAFFPEGRFGPTQMQFIHHDEVHAYENDQLHVLSVAQEAWTLKDGQIYLPKSPETSSTDAIRVWYYRRLAQMHTGTLSSGSASGAVLPASATLGEVQVTDDYYNGSKIYISGGTGSGQQRTISDYVGDTRAITVSSAWTTTPGATSTYEILCTLPPTHAEIVIVGACRRAVAFDTKKNSIFDAEYFRLLESFMFEIEREQIQQADNIRAW